MARKILELGPEDWITGIGAGQHLPGTGIFALADGINPYVDPFLNSANFGLLQPCDGGTQVGSGTIDEVPVAIIHRNNTNAYALGDGGDFYTITLSDDSAAVQTNQDAVVALKNGFISKASGSELLYYINGANGTELGTWDFSTTFDNDAKTPTTTNLESGGVKPVHYFAKKHWIGNVDRIAYLDDADALTLNALDFDSEFTVKCLSDDDYHLVIGIATQTATQNLGGTTKVVFWDTFSPSWNKEWTIPESSIQAIQRVGNRFYAVCARALYVFNYSSPPQKVLDLDTTHANNVNDFNAIAALGSAVLWGATDINMFGRFNTRVPNAFATPFSFALRATTIKSLNTTAAAGKIYIGGNNSKMYKVSTTSGGDTTGLLARTHFINLKDVYDVTGITVVFGAKLASGDDVRVTLTNREGDTQNIDSTFTALGAISRQYQPCTLKADQLQITIGGFNGGVPKIKNIIVYGERTSEL